MNKKKKTNFKENINKPFIIESRWSVGGNKIPSQFYNSPLSDCFEWHSMGKGFDSKEKRDEYLEYLKENRSFNFIYGVQYEYRVKDH